MVHLTVMQRSRADVSGLTKRTVKRDTLGREAGAEMVWFKAFLAGFFSTLVFHQGLLAILHAAGASPRAAYALNPTPPLNVPAVLSLAFWGGVWGILLWLVIPGAPGARYWLLALVLRAIAPSAVALLVVLPLK